tara:strand:- start:318 stop:761 length:444 start_codon:yes stop_codon:yes gene_type:complete
MSKKRKFKGLTRIVVEDLLIPSIKQSDEDLAYYYEIKKEGLKKNIRCIYCDAQIVKELWNMTELYICTNDNPSECKGHTGKLSQRWNIAFQDLPLSWYRVDSEWYKYQEYKKQKKVVPYKEQQDINRVKGFLVLVPVIIFWVWLFQA